MDEYDDMAAECYEWLLEQLCKLLLIKLINKTISKDWRSIGERYVINNWDL